ncbi:laminin subunit gamma-1 isoform X2 [Heptranchias perlo]|uniref:laminin subunit gamma-1 isoform X2 n=1 Tax=Heptranchias perlo TaxID=212740 RepID=UPI00355AA272
MALGRSGTRKKVTPSELRGSLWPSPGTVRWRLRLALLGCLVLQCPAAMDECYDESARSQRCMPEFVNAAFNVTVVASNTCGFPPEEYCVQTGVTGVTKSCHICDSSDSRLQHGAVYLTDYNNQADTTWWQSQTMLAGIQYPNSISLTLHLGKAFDITYVRLKFHTSRPESFVIYKRTNEDGPWVPYQYYSGSCEKTYQKLNRGFIRTGEDEQQALCTDEFSDISPLTGGNVAFSTLEGRPSAYNFDNSPVLQEWVTATDIKVTLNRLNTFGDEVFNDPKVLKSYYYAISDFAVGGRCKCNGHASECINNEFNMLVCNCKHNTMGVDCGSCQPFYNDRPWRRATAENPNECLPCNCHGKSAECYFDSELYRATGHGGHCRNCIENTDGANCERCKPGFFNLDPQNPHGCTACFCFGHSSVCSKAEDYSTERITSSFDTGADGWRAEQRDGAEVLLQWSPVSRDISVVSNDYFPVYYIAPANILGNQLMSYGQNLSFTFHVDKRDTRLSAEDLVLEGAGLRVTVPLIAQGNQYPTESPQNYVFRLHEVTSYPWRPQLSSFEFQRLLQNLTAIKIRGTYSEHSPGHLDDVTLLTARPGSGSPAEWVEQCTCPTAYWGQFCEQCAPGYRREDPSRGSFSPCVPCSCNAHSDTCDPENGECYCRDNTAGSNCERCMDGYYGDPTVGSSEDCSPCPCPSGSSCAMVPKSRDIVCTNCPTGTTGKRCELCDDGYYGDPLGEEGPVRPCKSCHCSDNIDPNAVGNCNRITGECLKCIYNTDGFYCDKCKDGFYGNALNPIQSEKCNACNCSPYGTVDQQRNCNQVTGLCECLIHVVGRDCSQCEPGFYNLLSGQGCQRCDCNPIGSVNGQCDSQNGQCECQPGVVGRQCDECEPDHFGFGQDGCKPCDCDREGSRSLQCKEDGKCDCKEGFVGTHCDQCEENYFYNRTRPGCQECPTCYRLVKDKVNEHRQKLKDLEDLIANLGTSQDIVSDKAFEERLKETERAIMDLLRDAKNMQDVDKSLMDRLAEINNTLSTQWGRLQNIKDTVDNTEDLAERSNNRIQDAEKVISNARRELEKAKETLGNVSISTPDSSADPNNMTLLAEEARNLAERHKNEADEIEQIAKNANDTSTKAYELLHKTLAEESEITNTIDDLNRKYDAAKNMSRELEKQATKVHNEATDAGSKALQIYANLTSLPVVDTKALENEAKKIVTDAADLDGVIDRKLKDYNDMRDDLKAKETEVKTLLEKGKTEQQTADQLLARADAAKALAEDAAKKGKATLQEAQDILKNLQDFDKRVNDNKTAAEEALKKIPHIRKTIDDANAKTKQAEDALGNARMDASEAKKKAEDAEQIANTLQESAAKTKQDADDTFNDAMDLEEEVSDMMERLKKAEDELAVKKDEADQDMMMADMASQAAKEADEQARKAKKAVQGVLNTINKLLGELGQLDNVDVNRLKEIEKTLNNAKDQMKDSDLERKLADLEKAEKEQANAIITYEQDIQDILKDIRNLEDIKQTLPPGCYNTQSLETP